MLEKSSKIGRPDWTTSEPAVAVICQKSYLKLLQFSHFHASNLHLDPESGNNLFIVIRLSAGSAFLIAILSPSGTVQFYMY
ncbi:hypothetical protein TNCV_1965851 [Trichonephila clavipes]|nr:hypothetical protein TNCV_1965851 [Trichonephila clavipes]